MNNETLSQLAARIIALRSTAQGGVISAPTMPFIPDDHLLGEYIEIRSEGFPQPRTYKSGGHTGAMIALFVPNAVGVRFIQSDSGALPLNELHITLAYLGNADDLSHRQIIGAHELMRLISENHPPLDGHINGCGRFCNGDDDGDPFFIIPDLPALPNLRQAIIDGLRNYDIKGASDHGFTPHITLTYLSHAEHNPFDIIEKTPVTFGAISLVLGDDRYDYPLPQGVPLLSKADLIEKIGARHTHAERGLIQAVHDMILDLGAECHSLTRRAGARHSHADQGLVQRIHDDCTGLGATCKGLPEKDRVYGSQVLKEVSQVERGGPSSGPQKDGSQTLADNLRSQGGRDEFIKNLKAPLKWSRKKRSKIIATLKDNFPIEDVKQREKLAKKRQKAAPKGSTQAANSGAFAAIFAEVSAGLSKKSLISKAQSDAPNYQPASTPQRCANCRFFLGDPGRDWCELFDFTADPDYVSDAWEHQRPNEIPGYVANKGDLTLRNWENSSSGQRKARDAINNAIKAGTLKKARTKRCSRCGKRPGAEYHHVDGYAEGKKLNVRAVCNQCHARITNGATANKGDLAALTEGILTLRDGATSGTKGERSLPKLT